VCIETEDLMLIISYTAAAKESNRLSTKQQLWKCYIMYQNAVVFTFVEECHGVTTVGG
jgi:hypothetical protein